MSKEFDELVEKAKKFGIDFQVILDEIDRRIESKVTSIAKSIIDQVPQLKPDIDELATAVAGKIQMGQVNVDEVIDKVLEKIPDTAAAEKKKVLADAAEQITQFMSNVDKKVEGMVKPLVDAALVEQRAGMIQAVRDELNARHEEIMAELAGAGGNGGKVIKAGKLGAIPWDQVLPVLRDMVKKDKDPFAGIDQFLNMRERIMRLEPAGPDINAQFRASSASFLEGIKLGSKVKGGIEPKKLSGPPGGPSKQPVKSTVLHPAVETL